MPLLAADGRILNVSSGLARFATPGYSAYATMKGAVEVLTRYLARELGPRGIAKVVAITGASSGIGEATARHLARLGPA